ALLRRRRTACQQDLHLCPAAPHPQQHQRHLHARTEPVGQSLPGQAGAPGADRGAERDQNAGDEAYRTHAKTEGSPPQTYPQEGSMITSETLKRLEFDKILAEIADQAHSDITQERILATAPLDDADRIRIISGRIG